MLFFRSGITNRGRNKKIFKVAHYETPPSWQTSATYRHPNLLCANIPCGNRSSQCQRPRWNEASIKTKTKKTWSNEGVAWPFAQASQRSLEVCRGTTWREGGIVEHRRSDGTPPRSIYFRFTKREPTVDTIATTLAPCPLNTHQRWNRLRVTFFLRYWIIARGHEPNERSNANTRTDRFDFFLGKVTDSLN